MFYSVMICFDNEKKPFKVDVHARDSKHALNLALQDARMGSIQGAYYGEVVASIVTELG